MKITAFFAKRSKFFWILACMGLVLVLGVSDLITGYEYSFSLFYLIPIVMAAWYVGTRAGLLIAGLSAVIWFLADIGSGNQYSSSIAYLWNVLIRLGFYLIVVTLLFNLKRALTTEQELARLDYNTGAVNARYFYELAQLEIDRLNRYKHSLAMAYIDLDNFKLINDRFGHSIGDQVLRRVVQILHGQIRRNDIIARMGGDEFALLLSEIDQIDVEHVIKRISSNLQADMEENHWPVTFSIGVVKFQTSPENVDEMVKAADQAMYTIKNGAKNGVFFTDYNKPSTTPAFAAITTKPRKNPFQ